MLKRFAYCLLFLIVALHSAQGQVKIGDGTVQGENAIPNVNAILDLSSIQRGVLFPRIALTATTDAAPLTAHVAGMMVYNTNTQNDVVPAIYYNDGTKWVFVGSTEGSNISYDPTTYIITYLDGGGNPQTINLVQAIKANETPTILIKESEGRYTYYNERAIDEQGNPIVGAGVVIDVPADVINNFEDIITNTEVLNQLIENLTNTRVGGNVYYDGNQFTYVDESGDRHVITFEDLIKTAETKTQLIANTDGTYTYYNEVEIDAEGNPIAGTGVVINIPASVIQNFEEIINNEEVKNELFETIHNSYVGGNVYYDGNQFTYVDESGDSHVINFEEIVKDNETVTTLVEGSDGKYTYTSENNTVTVIDIPASVVQNFETIVNSGPVEVNGDTFTTIEEYIEHIANSSVTIGGSDFITVTGTGTSDDPYVVSIKEGDANSMLITNEAGELEWATIESIVKDNETVTTLEKLGEGQYLYTSEDGTETTINVTQDVIENFETIVNESNTEVIEQLITVLGDTYVGGNVYYDGNQFTYVDESGDTHVINFEEIVKDNETVTTLEKLGEGQYLYTSEDGTETTINVTQDVIENFETIVNESNTEVIEQLITVLGDTYVGGNVYYDGNQFTYVDESGDSHVINFEEIVKDNETVTTLVAGSDGKYTYTSENNTVTVIDIPASVVQNFETIVNSGPVEVNGDTFTTIEEYIEHIANSSVTIGGSDFITVTGTGTSDDPYVVSIKEGDANSMLITNEAGELEWATIESIVKDNETVTTLEKLGEGQYLYTSEDGTETTINVTQDVIENFETIVNESNTEVIEQLITVLGDTYVGGNVYYDGNQFTYVDESGDTHVINFEELVKTAETKTQLVANTDGTYTYYNEVEIDADGNPIAGTGVVIDIPASVIQNFEEIINNEEVKNELFETIHNSYVGGNVYYDGNQFTYVDESGDTHVINFEELVKTAETKTQLVANTDGTYTYYNEVEIDADGNPIAGTGVVIDIPASVIQNFEEIINNEEVKNELFETIHNSYVGGNVYYDGNQFTYVDESGDTHVINFEELVKTAETKTQLVANTDGTYTYYNEVEIDADGNPIAGTGVVIDIPASVIQNFEEIINNEEVKNELFETIHNSYVGGNVYYDGNQFTYVDESGDTHVINFEELVKTAETKTQLVANTDGTYTYYNEVEIDADGNPIAGTGVVIDIPASVIQNFEEIINNEEVKNELFETIHNSYVGGNVYYDGNQFTYVDESGDTHVINFEELVKTAETKTQLVANTDGTYTYYNEVEIDADGNPIAGTGVVIDIPASVIQNFEEIINNEEVKNELFETIHNSYVGGNVYYDGNQFTYVDESGDTHVINFEELVKTAETKTQLVANTDGTYTYYNEVEIDADGNPIAGTGVVIDIPASVIQNFEEIINNEEVKNELFETIHNSYVGGNVYYDGNQFTYVDESGDTHVINFEELVKTAETKTQLVANTDGTYTYYNEVEIDADGNPIAGTGVVIDIPASVIQNFEEIINNEEVKNELFETIHNSYVGGNVYYDGNQFTYVDESGDTHVINFEELVKTAETKTQLVANTDGTYTYYNEVEIDADGNPIAGTGVVIDIPASVIQNFEEIINNEEVKNELFETIHNSYVGGNVYYDGNQFTYVDESGDTHVINFEELVKTAETKTQLVANTDGTYTYYNEVEIDADGNPIAGTGVVIDIPASVIQNFEEIINNEEVKNELFETIHNSYVGGNVYYDGNQFTYVDESGDTHVINFEELVKTAETKTQLVANTDGTYTYYNEVEIDADGNPIAGTGVVIDIPASVIQNFEEIINNEEVKNELFETIHNSYVGGNVYYDGNQFTYVDESGDTHVINFEELVKTAETKTQLVANTDGTYTYYNEVEIDADGNPIAGTGVVIDIPASVIQNFEEIINNEEVKNELFETIHNSYVGGNVYYDGNQFTYVDESGDTHVINFEEIIQANQKNTEVAPGAGIAVTDATVDNTTTYTVAVKAESGLEIHDDKVKLGGDLTRNTTITQNGNPFTIATGGSNLNITDLDKTKVQATDATAGITDRLLAVDANDKVKALKAAMPKFFYMPSVLVPTAESQVGQTGVTFNNQTRTGTINLYTIYVAQFGSPVMSSAGAAPLPVLPASELGFHVTYATQGVFTITGITAEGLMTYTVSPSADITNGSFINIVFSVNED